VAHAICAAVAAVLLWRALAQVWVDETATDAVTAEVLRVAIPAFSAAASALAIAAGAVTSRSQRLFALDALSWGALLVIVFALTLGRLDREYIGVLFVLALAVRIAPAAIACVTGDRPPWLIFATAFTAYAALAAWHQAAALPLGDQVHYLLVADRLAHGTVDATIDADLFRRLSTLTASDFDNVTHLFNTPLGPRAIQGYAIPLLLLPGWLAAGRFGAELVVAFFASLASVATVLILRDTIASVRLRGVVWAMTTFLAPGVLLAFHIYPNAFGAAAIGFAYRYGITAPVRRPLLAGICAGLTLFLNPRDGLVLAVLLIAMWWVGRRDFRRFAIGAVAVGLVAAISNAFLYGVPLPYIGYFLAVVYPKGVSSDAVTAISFVSFEFWIALPGMLFDRTFGIAGVAPWLFIAVIGIPAALRASRRVFAPAAITLGLSLLGLSVYHYWEGGYAPSARYFVDVLPLAAPFVAFGLAVTRDWWMRIFTGVLIGVSALETLVLCAMPSRALNDAFQGQAQEVLDQILGLNPIGWLPSFEQTAPDWYVAAYVRLLPALAINYSIHHSILPIQIVRSYFEYPDSPWLGSEHLSGMNSNGVQFLLPYAFQTLIGPKGFLIYNPFLAIALGGLTREIWRRGRFFYEGVAVAAGSTCLALYYWLMTNNYAGWSYSIRWFVPMLPLLLFFLFPYFETFNSRRRAWYNVLLGVSAVIACVGALNPWSALVYNDIPFVANIEQFITHLRQPLAFP